MSDHTVQVPIDHPAFAGHFPGQPLLPGVTLLSEVLEAVMRDATLSARVGPAPRLGAVKFLAPVRPGATLAVRFEPTDTALRFEVRDGARAVASGHFEAAA
jgi:3-hydroxyacyl-[acyl-carrier-protein] dehydratase